MKNHKQTNGNSAEKSLVVSFDAIQCYTDYRYLQQYYILTENYIYFIIIAF